MMQGIAVPKCICLHLEVILPLAEIEQVDKLHNTDATAVVIINVIKYCSELHLGKLGEDSSERPIARTLR